ncbi:hypothetical protein ABZZ79_06315 [Streptomyces sp. NPDC006458]|uniref:hypothetical protein n=1 Tax=Streptomyces sp. NPDC006458 TaxID=3154302 RepID=UPI0033B10D2B
MAAPQVAGAAALYEQAHPNAGAGGDLHPVADRPHPGPPVLPERRQPQPPPVHRRPLPPQNGHSPQPRPADTPPTTLRAPHSCARRRAKRDGWGVRRPHGTPARPRPPE